jgi:hypothetical protein
MNSPAPILAQIDSLAATFFAQFSTDQNPDNLSKLVGETFRHIAAGLANQGEIDAAKRANAIAEGAEALAANLAAASRLRAAVDALPR